MYSTFQSRNGKVTDFRSARFGSLTPPGVRLRPLPISSPIVYPAGIYIEVDNIDRSSSIEWSSLDVSNILTRQVDTADFSFKMLPSAAFSVEIGQNIKIYDSQDLIFQGKVTRVRKTALSAALLRVGVTCVDYTRELDNKVVAETYENQTAEFIIKDILTRYAPQFTDINVNAPITINFIRFSYQLVSECFQELAEMTGYDWYVDQYKDVHFRLSSSVTSPFDLLDTNGSYLMGSITFEDDISQLKNSIYLRGGDEIGLSQTYAEIADGDKLVFPLGYHFSALPTVTVNAVAKTVGTLGTDNALSFDCMWDPKNDFIQFATPPTVGETLEVSGLPLNPILLYLPERVSIAEHGERQYVIIDKTITTRAGARQRALAEILKYAQTVTSIRFTTLTSGLRAGQTMIVNTALFGIEGEYIVTQVSTSMRGPTQYQYDVTLISTKLMDIIDLLAQMLTSKLKEQTYDANESFDPTEVVFEEILTSESVTPQVGGDASVSETVSFGESVTKPGGTGLNFGTIFVAGPWVPSTTKRVFNLERSLLG